MIKSSRARLAAKLEAARNAGYADGYYRGFHTGEEQAIKRHAEDLKTQARKTDLELARALSSMVESTARAVVAFVGEKGFRP